MSHDTKIDHEILMITMLNDLTFLNHQYTIVITYRTQAMCNALALTTSIYKITSLNDDLKFYLMFFYLGLFNLAEREGLLRTSMYSTPLGPAQLFKIVPDNFVKPSSRVRTITIINKYRVYGPVFVYWRRERGIRTLGTSKGTTDFEPDLSNK